MKKIIAATLCFLLVFSSVSCRKHNDVPPEDMRYEITYELGSLRDDFIDTPTSAEYGDTVEIRTQILIDADIHVYVDGKEIQKSHYDSDYWGYTFTMPQKSVIVTAKPYSKNEIWGLG